MENYLKFKPIAIGSLPHNNVEEAMSIVATNFTQIPFFPQLTNVQKAEDMVYQFLEGFPGINELSKFNLTLDTDSENFYNDLETLFVDYETLTSFSDYKEILIDKNYQILNKYKISEKCSSTFKNFVQIIKEQKPKYAKGQIVGPFTLSTSMKNSEGINFVFDQTLTDIITRVLGLKVLWQIIQIKKANPDTVPIIFMDEPTLSQLGTSAYLTVSKDDVKHMFSQIVNIIHKCGALCGIHCCGKCDWEIPIDVNANIINPDAYSFGEHFSIYHKRIKEFLEKGGKIAWGIVPTLDENILSNITLKDLIEKFNNSVTYLTNTGIDEKLIKDNSLITSSCGAGGLSKDGAKKAMILVRELSEELMKRESIS